jgi:hypothetical protein
MSSNGHRYDVGGILMERPFKIRRLGHFGFNITRLEEARRFYGDLLGFVVSDKADFSRAPWYPKEGFPKDAGFDDATAISCATAPTTTRWCCSRSR